MLQVERLTKRYGAIVGIDDVSFTVRPGEVLGLLGPNGSGKSTTVRILTGLLDQTSGHVLLDGSDVAADMLEFKTHIGYVPEEPYLYSYLTGPEYLLLVGRLRGLPEDLLEDKIERFLQASRWSMEPPEDLATDEGRIAVLDIGAASHRHAES